SDSFLNQPTEATRMPAQNLQRPQGRLAVLAQLTKNKKAESIRALPHREGIRFDRNHEQVASGLTQREGVLVGTGGDSAAPERQRPAVDAQATFAEQKGTQSVTEFDLIAALAVLPQFNRSLIEKGTFRFP